MYNAWAKYNRRANRGMTRQSADAIQAKRLSYEDRIGSFHGYDNRGFCERSLGGATLR